MIAAKAMFEEFKSQNENWQDILDAFLDVKQVDEGSNRSYWSQQQTLDKLNNEFETLAGRAFSFDVEVMFALAGSAIFQNDALNRLYLSKGLKNVRACSRSLCFLFS